MNDEERYRLEQRHRLALHEAGHATMMHLFGIPVDTVSIRPGEYFRGVTISRLGGLAIDEIERLFAHRGGDSLLAHYGLRPALFDAGLLGRVAVEIACDLAGEEASLMLAWPPSSGFRADDDLERATERALSLTAPSPEELADLEAMEHERSPSDEERVYTAARALADEDLEAASLVAYMRNVTRRMIVSDLFSKPCLVVAGALEEHTILGGEAIAQLFDEHIEDPRNFGRELVAVGTQKEEGTMALLRKKKEITEATRVGELVVCDRGIVWSTAGSCREGAIIFADSPIVKEVPEAFRPLIERLGG